MLPCRPAHFCLVVLCCILPSAPAQSPTDPNHLAGVVTRLTSPADLALNGTPVELSPTVTFATVVGHTSTQLAQAPALFLGESLQLVGQPRHKKPFLAQEVRIILPSPTPVAGTALIDRLFPPLASSPAHPASASLVRADGYLLSLPASVLSPSAASALAPHQILTFRGTLQPDGAVEVSSAVVELPTVSKGEQKLRDRSEYDQEVMDAAAHSTPQGRLSQHFRGVDIGRLPVVDDPVLQARVDRIGQSLLPPAARSLPPTDPLFLPFHFRVVDAPQNIHGPIPLPSGTVLLPAAAIDRLSVDHPTPAQLDSRIASALAFGIAHVREEHLLRAMQLATKLTATAMAGDIAGIFVPGLGIATSITTGSIQEHAAHLRGQQDTRIALALLHDAGYDLSEAGLSSALLDTSSPKPVEQLKLTPDTLDLFTDLGRLYSPTSLSTTVLPPQTPSSAPNASPGTRPAS